MSDTKHVTSTRAPSRTEHSGDEIDVTAGTTAGAGGADTSGGGRSGVPGSAVPDEVAAAAVDVARAAAEADEPGLVGAHLGVSADDLRVVTHYFATLDPAYRGWRWAVTVARAPRAKSVTVDDVVLLPGDEALLAPEWVPWSERLRPGDLGVGDLLPTAADDPRLAPTFLTTDDEAESDVAFELGLGRERVLSYDGRLDAVDRWYAGEPGPEAAMARSAPAACATCGFFVPLSGALRQAFGACANEMAPDDSRVVSVDHGCGAHSQAVVVPSAVPQAVAMSPDGSGYDVVGGPLGHEPGSVSDAEPAEPLGHS
jgi:hypothetical protein